MIKEETTPETSLKSEVEEILEKRTTKSFNADSDHWVEFVHNLDCEYVVATIRNRKLHNIVSMKGNPDKPTVWLINRETKQIEYLSINFSDFHYPLIAKVDLQLDGDLMKVNLAICEKDNIFDFPSKRMSVGQLMKYVYHSHKLVSVNVSI
ncbi:MAG: hypothetical protein WD552_02560 [Candidatus Paceibacterota bacterium]